MSKQDKILKKIGNDVVDTYNELTGFKCVIYLLLFLVGLLGVFSLIVLGFNTIEPSIITEGTLDRINIKNPRIAVVDDRIYEICWSSDLEILQAGDRVRIKSYDIGQPMSSCKEIELVSVGGKEDGSGLTTC